jgi:hypothetical protein
MKQGCLSVEFVCVVGFHFKAEAYLFDRDDILMLKILEIPFVTFPTPIRPPI